MKLEVAYYILILIISLFYSAVSFEVFTAAGVAIASVLYKNTVCRLSECCTEKEIPANFASKFLVCSYKKRFDKFTFV